MIDATFCNAVSLLTGFTGWVLAVEGDGQGDWLWADAAAREEKAIPSAFRAFVKALE